jgi:hypothetical protein
MISYYIIGGCLASRKSFWEKYPILRSKKSRKGIIYKKSRKNRKKGLTSYGGFGIVIERLRGGTETDTALS